MFRWSNERFRRECGIEVHWNRADNGERIAYETDGERVDGFQRCTSIYKSELEE